MSAAQKVCQDKLIQDYSVTYHPVLRNACYECHSNAHGSKDVRLSFNAFKAKGQTLIDYQASNPHGENNVNISSQIAAIQPAWEIAQAEYATCLSQNPDEEIDSGLPFLVRGKALAGITKTFREYSWNLATETSADNVIADRSGEFKAVFRIEARLYEYEGKIVGFEFQKPTLQLAADQKPVQLDGILFILDGKVQDFANTYAKISVDVSGTAKTPLAADSARALVVFAGTSAATKVGFQFISLK